MTCQWARVRTRCRLSLFMVHGIVTHGQSWEDGDDDYSSKTNGSTLISNFCQRKACSTGSHAQTLRTHHRTHSLMDSSSYLGLLKSSEEDRTTTPFQKTPFQCINAIDNLHNYGPGTRFAGEIWLRCVCFSLELSFFFCIGMSFSDHCCVPRFFNRGRASPSLFCHGFSRSSELRKRWFLAIRQAAWSHFRVPNNTVVCIEQVLPAKNFAFMLVPKSLWTLPSPVLWNRVRLDTSQKQVQCHRCFLFTRMGPKWEYETCRRRESDMFAPAVVWAKCWGHSLSEAGRKEGDEVAMQAKFVPGAFFFVCLFQVALGKAPGVYTQRSVYARWRLRDTWRSRGSAFLNSKRMCPLFFSSTLSDERCSHLSFESPNQNPKNRTLNSHRDTGGTRCILWEVTM